MLLLSGRGGLTVADVAESLFCCMGPFAVIGVVFTLTGMLILGVGGDERFAYVAHVACLCMTARLRAGHRQGGS